MTFPFINCASEVACLATQLLQEEPINWQQMPFILPLDGMAAAY